MQQWMSALLDDGFVTVKKLKDKQGWLTSVRQRLRRQDLAFYQDGIHALVKRWTETVEIILKSEKLIVNVVVFKLCNCI